MIQPVVVFGPTHRIMVEQLEPRKTLIKDPIRGFTFFGMIFVILLTSVFGSMIYITLNSYEGYSFSEVTLERMEILRKAIYRYKSDATSGNAPASLDNLITLVAPACYMDTNSSSITYRRLRGWCGPYLDRPVAQAPNDFKTDGWGTIFQYNGTTITSCGGNRTCGNSDDITLPAF